MKINDYLMIAEAANYLGVVQNTLRNWGKSGKLQTIRNPINGYRMYRKEDLDKILQGLTFETVEIDEDEK